MGRYEPAEKRLTVTDVERVDEWLGAEMLNEEELAVR